MSEAGSGWWLETLEDLPSAAVLASWPRPPRPGSVLMAEASAFRIASQHNPHMDPRGRPALTAQAVEQSAALARAYTELGLRVELLPADPALPDLVFTANPSALVVGEDGRCEVLLSAMRHPERQGEVEHHRRFFEARGLVCHRTPEGFGPLEGHGDLLWHPAARLLLGGYGHRSTPRALRWVAEHLRVPLVPLRLIDERLYHLDTALVPLDAESCLWVPSAFDGPSRERIATLFARRLEAEPTEAYSSLAANAHAPLGREVLIEQRNHETIRRLEASGFPTVPLDTSEFLKSGGSVFCLKQALPEQILDTAPSAR